MIRACISFTYGMCEARSRSLRCAAVTTLKTIPGCRQGSADVLCLYPRINNFNGCLNSKALNGLLKEELGFQGVVLSDHVAQHAEVTTALACMDMAMPSGNHKWGGNLTEAVRDGSVTKSRVTDMATRMIVSWHQMGYDKDFPFLVLVCPRALSKLTR